MIALQVQYLTGPNAGRKLLLRETRITFGRSDERSLPIDLPFVSREHGEFRFQDGQWLLVNHSNNATLLNGKPVTRKPRPIKGPSTIGIGDQQVFRVEPITTGATDDPAEQDAHASVASPQQDEPSNTQADGGKIKLWAGIGVFWIVAFGLIAFVTLNQSDITTSTTSDLIQTLLAQDIRQEIAAPPDKSPPDDRRAAQELARAHEHYALIERRTDALYNAYDAYRLALTYTRGDSFDDPQDQRRFHVLQTRLTQGVISRYDAAYHLLRSRQYQAADRAFKDLRSFYPDPSSPVFKDALKREADARDALAKKRR